MLTIILLAIVAAALAGLGVRSVLRLKNSEHEISWREYAIGMVIITLVVSPLVGWIGWKLAQNGNASFNEYWNGWEISADAHPVTCTRDGPCRYEYDCDPYVVMVSYDCNCSTDKDGRSHCSTCWRPETRYHDCPYVTTETTYTINTTLGRYTIAEHQFPANPDANRWRASKPVPADVAARAGTGQPPFWAGARSRCQAGQPGPVTARRTYENYVLASDWANPKKYSADIQEFRKANELPAIRKDVQAFYHADKVHFVGARPPDAPLWQNAVEYLNARLGSELQGDLHLVLVRNDTISADPGRYVYALKAYWQDPRVFGHDVLSKNGIVVVVGTKDGQTVTWSRAFTGMPIGNEKMLDALNRDLDGKPLTPEALAGPGGVLQSVLWGQSDPAIRFKRQHMKGEDGKSGYLYLKNEIQLTGGQKWAVFTFTLLACLVVWVVFALRDERSVNKEEY